MRFEELIHLLAACRRVDLEIVVDEIVADHLADRRIVVDRQDAFARHSYMPPLASLA